MGRRKKRGARKPSRLNPDDYFSVGPSELARFGKVVLIRSRSTPDQLRSMTEEMANSLPGLVAEIDATRFLDRVEADAPPCAGPASSSMTTSPRMRRPVDSRGRSIRAVTPSRPDRTRRGAGLAKIS